MDGYFKTFQLWGGLSSKFVQDFLFSEWIFLLCFLELKVVMLMFLVPLLIVTCMMMMAN